MTKTFRGLWTLILATLALAASMNEARADIIFLNMNGSATEIPAVQALARANGERLIVIPKNPGALSAQEYITKNAVTEMVELAMQGVRPRTLIVSGHHSREEGFWGKNGEVALYYIEDLLPTAGQPGYREAHEFFQSLQSVYLWGCYTGSLTHAADMLDGQNAAFANVRYVVGFGEKGPINTDPLSGRMLADALSKEAQLRSGGMDQTFQILKTIPSYQQRDLIIHKGKSFVSHEGWSNQDMYLKSCVDESRKQRLAGSIGTIWEYYYGKRGPVPDDTAKGELRLAYQELQRYNFCISMGAVKFSQFEEIPELTFTLRLIFYKNVLKNFIRQNGPQLSVASSELRAGGFKDVDFVNQFEQLDRAVLIKKLKSLTAQTEVLYPPGLSGDRKAKKIYYYNLIRDLQMVVFTDAEAIPATWIDSGAKATASFNALGKFEEAKADARRQEQAQAGAKSVSTN